MTSTFSPAATRTEALVAAAWYRYLWATQGACGTVYEEREERAWQRLVDELFELGIDLRTAP